MGRLSLLTAPHLKPAYSVTHAIVIHCSFQILNTCLPFLLFRLPYMYRV
jgi:hypothetical protein